MMIQSRPIFNIFLYLDGVYAETWTLFDLNKFNLTNTSKVFG